MLEPWNERWCRLPGGPRFQGGQGKSFLARSRDDSETVVFIKVLARRTDRRARGRFRAEAAAYETLAGLGPPELFEDNSETWGDTSFPEMYMVLEYIDGSNLQDFIQRNGPTTPNQAFACIQEVGSVLTRCHERGLLHRDIKPANIMLRGDDLTQPVLVDFGLSFNDEREGDLTRVNEQIGNKFLRLPEHRRGVRAAGSDATQLAGVFLYMITGEEPAMLLDEENLMPHLRPESRIALDRLGIPRSLRLLRVFDRAFRQELATRYGTTSGLIRDLEIALTRDLPADSELDYLNAQIDDFVNSRNLPELKLLRQKLEYMLHDLDRIVVGFAETKGLERFNCDWNIYEREGWAEVNLAIGERGKPPNYAHFQAKACGPGEFAVTVDGEDIWRRGERYDGALVKAVETAVAKNMLPPYNLSLDISLSTQP